MRSIARGAFAVTALASTLGASPALAGPAGTVVAWGDNTYGQLDVPAGLRDAVAVAAGTAHTVALRSNGTVVAWGESKWGQLAVPTGLSGVTAIAAGGWQTVALLHDGTVASWGYYPDFGPIEVPAGLSHVVAVAAGSQHAAALKGDGTVVTWGHNLLGAVEPPVGLAGVTALAAGYYHTAALKSDGTVVAWGDNGSGQTSVPLGLSDVKAIAAGGLVTVALRSDGTVVAWGGSYWGQTNIPQGLSGVAVTAAGFYNALALKSDGTVVSWGGNYWGDVPAGLASVTAVTAGGWHSVAIGLLRPIANAGPIQTVHAGSVVTLDGSGSSDPQGLVPLTYAWTLASAPAGSAAALSSATSVNPTFRADVPGDYTVSLVVTNTAGLASVPSTVLISTRNSAPVAEAGPDQAITLRGTTVTLDGIASYDPDGDPITYQWTFASLPAGSQAILSGATTATATFVADVHGDYVLGLTVSDPWTAGAPDTVTIGFANLRPVADAGSSGSAYAGVPVFLDGTRSSDPNGDPITFQWSFTAKPAGSDSTLSSPTSPTPSFVPDREGTYVVQLVVSDGLLASEPSAIQIQSVMTPSAAVSEVTTVQETVASVPPAALKNPTMTNALNNKLNAVIQAIQAGNYATALAQLENDILRKTDGCATSTPPAPDKNDWITTCAEQAVVYDQVLQLIAVVMSLM